MKRARGKQRNATLVGLGIAAAAALLGGNARADGFGTEALWSSAITCGPSDRCVIGDFTYRETLRSGLEPKAADIIRFTANGDVYVARASENAFLAPSLWLSGFAPSSWNPVVGDFNGDGYDDIAVDYGSGMGIQVALSDGFQFVVQGTWSSYVTPEPPLVGDVNGDGLADLICNDGGEVKVLLSTSMGFDWPVWWADTNGIGQHIADVDNDGRADLLGFLQGSGADVLVYLSKPWGEFVYSGVYHSYFAPSPEQPAAANFDGSGGADILTFLKQGTRVVVGAYSLGTSFGTPSGGANTAELVHTSFCSDSDICLTGDVNGDGKDDLVAIVTQSGGGHTAGEAYVSLRQPCGMLTPVGSSCADGLWCNGAETCHTGEQCFADTSPEDDGNACTFDQCDEMTQQVSHTPIDPSDWNACTSDWCDPQFGVQNVPLPSGTSCSDGNACNGLEICDGMASCGAAQTPNLDDGNPCTADSCDASGQVIHTPLTGTSCSDGNACNGLEICQAGSCVLDATNPPPAPPPNWDPQCSECSPDPRTGESVWVAKTGVSCDDGSSCTTADSCAVAGGNATCLGGAAAPNGTSCADGDICNGSEACFAGTCQSGSPPVLNDGNDCTYDTCDSGSAVVNPPLPKGTLCNAGQGECDGAGRCLGQSEPLPPVPQPVPLDPTVAVDFASAVSFLHQGAGAIQQGVSSGALSPERIGVVRGRVLGRDAFGAPGSEKPLPNVKVEVVGESGIGHTMTRLDGQFDIAVNGGGLVTLRLQKAGYFTAWRQLQVPWNSYALLDDVVLVVPDTPSVTVDVCGGAGDLTCPTTMTYVPGAQVVEAKPGGGTLERQAFLIFPGNLQATITPEAGAPYVAHDIGVNITEYTVGPRGPASMPSDLPPTSGYTYAVELSVDGAKHVEFDKPVIHYVDNFLGVTPGEIVPSGYFDTDEVKWKASQNGGVIQLVSITAGKADIDLNGDGTAETPAQCQAAGISDEERQKLAEVYPGTGGSYPAPVQLWRTPVSHFSPWDLNFTVMPPACSSGGPCGNDDPGSVVHNRSVTNPSCGKGSIIECDNQVLGESLPLAGTSLTLNYRSSRAPGFHADNTILVRLPSTPKSALYRYEVQLVVAGHVAMRQAFPPELAGGTLTAVWDGQDVYGRPLHGMHEANLIIDEFYPVLPISTPSFGSTGGLTTVMNGSRAEFRRRRVTSKRLGRYEAEAQGLGGWTLSEYHAYDPSGQELFLGSGQRIGVAAAGDVIRKFAGTGALGNSSDGSATPVETTPIGGPRHVAVAADGSVYVATGANIRKVFRDEASNTWKVLTIAGRLDGAGGFDGDGPATSVRLLYVEGVAVGGDGAVYIADTGNHRIRRVKDGMLTTIVGGGTAGAPGFGDGGPATQAVLNSPTDVVVTADGTLYIADSLHHKVRKVDTNGLISTVAGNGSNQAWTAPFVIAPGTPNAAWKDAANHPYGATLATQVTMHPESLAIAADGAILVTHAYGGVFSIGNDGILRLVAGNGVGANGDGGSAFDAGVPSPNAIASDPNGVVYVVDFENRIRRIGADGKISTVAGAGAGGVIQFDALALQSALGPTNGLAVGPDNALYTTNWHNYVARIEPLDAVATPQGDLAIVSSDGALRYRFLNSGLHVRTENALTGATLLSFQHDAQGNLTQVTEPHPGAPGATPTVTTIARGPTSATITGPHGHQSVLGFNAAGQLAQVQLPIDALTPAQATTVATWSMQYDAAGLLSSFTDPRNNTSTFAYDVDGRLVSDKDASGGDQTLSSEVPLNWQGLVVTRSSPMGRIRTYSRESMPDGSSVRTVTNPDQTSTTSVLSATNTRTTTHADGTVTVQVEAPDPILSAPVSYAKTATLTTPLGLSQTVTRERPAPPESGLSFAWSEKVTIGGGTDYARVGFVSATNTVLSKSFAGRTREAVLDAGGRVVEARAPGLLPFQFEYDSQGRLATVRHGTGAGARIRTLAYHTGTNHQKGYLQSIQDTLGVQTTFANDALGRVLSHSVQSNTVALAWDALGNLTQVTPPGKPAHNLTYNKLDLGVSYEPPSVFTGPKNTWQTWNPDRAPTNLLEPSGASISWSYDLAGRPWKIASSDGDILLYYHPITPCSPSTGCAPGMPSTISGPAGQQIEFEWDGGLLKREIATGLTAGTLSRTYDNRLQIATETVSVGATTSQVALTYDPDGLLRCASLTTCPATQPGSVPADQLWLGYDPDIDGGVADLNGLLHTVTIGKVNETLSYNAFGDVATQVVNWDGNSIFQVDYDATAMPRDAAGRIRRKSETLDGINTVWDYTFDNHGRLTQVTKDGPVVAAFTYDANGNRLTATGMVGTAVYDGQDRPLSYPRSSTEQFLYTYSADGNLKEKTNTVGNLSTHYIYDVFGSLRSVLLPGGSLVEYGVDPAGRRVQKKKDGVVQQGWLFDGLQIVAELDATGALARRFVYASRANVPDYLIEGTTVYRILVDQLGSPRMVVNTATGAIVMKTTYDAFGNIENEWYNGFARLPFGFAGGHYDADTGLTRFGARDYDPVIGRWITKDPAGLAAGTNLYNYSGGDPVDYVDTNGEYAVAVPFIVAGGATAVVLAVAVQTGALPNPGPALWNLSQALNPFSAVANATKPIGNNPGYSSYENQVGACGDGISLATPSQAKIKVQRGQGPTGITRIDHPRGQLGAQWEAHTGGEGSPALKQDGTWKHVDSKKGPPKLPKKTLEWLREHEWNIP